MYKKDLQIFAKAVVLVAILQSSELTPAQAYTTVLQWGGSDIESCMQWLNAGGKPQCRTQTANKNGQKTCYWCEQSGDVVSLLGEVFILGGTGMCSKYDIKCGSNVQPLAN